MAAAARAGGDAWDAATATDEAVRRRAARQARLAAQVDVAVFKAAVARVDAARKAFRAVKSPSGEAYRAAWAEASGAVEGAAGHGLAGDGVPLPGAEDMARRAGLNPGMRMSKWNPLGRLVVERDRALEFLDLCRAVLRVYPLYRVVENYSVFFIDLKSDTPHVDLAHATDRVEEYGNARRSDAAALLDKLVDYAADTHDGDPELAIASAVQNGLVAEFNLAAPLLTFKGLEAGPQFFYRRLLPALQWGLLRRCSIAADAGDWLAPEWVYANHGDLGERAEQEFEKRVVGPACVRAFCRERLAALLLRALAVGISTVIDEARASARERSRVLHQRRVDAAAAAATDDDEGKDERPDWMKAAAEDEDEDEDEDEEDDDERPDWMKAAADEDEDEEDDDEKPDWMKAAADEDEDEDEDDGERPDWMKAAADEDDVDVDDDGNNDSVGANAADAASEGAVVDSGADSGAAEQADANVIPKVWLPATIDGVQLYGEADAHGEAALHNARAAAPSLAARPELCRAVVEQVVAAAGGVYPVRVDFCRLQSEVGKLVSRRAAEQHTDVRYGVAHVQVRVGPIVLSRTASESGADLMFDRSFLSARVLADRAVDDVTSHSHVCGSVDRHTETVDELAGALAAAAAALARADAPGPDDECPLRDLFFRPAGQHDPPADVLKLPRDVRRPLAAYAARVAGADRAKAVFAAAAKWGESCFYTPYNHGKNCQWSVTLFLKELHTALGRKFDIAAPGKEVEDLWNSFVDEAASATAGASDGVAGAFRSVVHAVRSFPSLLKRASSGASDGSGGGGGAAAAASDSGGGAAAASDASSLSPASSTQSLSEHPINSRAFLHRVRSSTSSLRMRASAAVTVAEVVDAASEKGATAAGLAQQFGHRKHPSWDVAYHCAVAALREDGVDPLQAPAHADTLAAVAVLYDLAGHCDR